MKKRIFCLLLTLSLVLFSASAMAFSFGPITSFGLMCMLEEYEMPEGYALCDWTEWSDIEEPCSVYLVCAEGVDEIIATSGYEGQLYLECTMYYADDSQDAVVDRVEFVYRLDPSAAENACFIEFIHWITTACSVGLSEEEAAELFPALYLSSDTISSFPCESTSITLSAERDSQVTLTAEPDDASAPAFPMTCVLTLEMAK